MTITTSFVETDIRKSGRRMSFMMEIEEAFASQHTPLEMLAADYFRNRSGLQSIDFCRRAVGVPDTDSVIAHRLSVAISTVRGWRDIGRRASGLSCQ